MSVRVLKRWVVMGVFVVSCAFCHASVNTRQKDYARSLLAGNLEIIYKDDKASRRITYATEQVRVACDENRTFKVDVKNGEYRVLVFIGDRGKYSHDKISVSAEGVVKVNNANTTAGDPGKEVLPFEFNVTVKDGQLDLLFQDGGGKDPYWMVNALYVRPVTDDNFFDEKGKAKFRVPRAVVFGQDNNLSDDNKIYLVSHGYSKGTGTNNWANGDALYLCRVDEGISNVIDHTRYEFWTGSKWSSSVEDAGPFLEWPDNIGGATITWNPGLKKYILVVHHNAKTGVKDCANEHRTIFMESDKITGPYKTIHYMTNWGPGSYFGNISAKWISKDGKTAWLVIAANCWAEPANPKQCVYSCSMHEFKFVTSSEVNPDRLTSGRWVVRADKPAKRWEDAFVTGNGRHGTMVMGQTSNERITCVHEEIFLRNWDRDIVGVPELAQYLPRMRQFIANGENESAGFVYEHAMKQAEEMGASKVWELMPHPAFDLCIDYQSSGTPTSYSNQLDLETGEVLCRWNGEKSGVEQRVFSSQIHNVNVVSLKASAGQTLNLTLSLNETPGREGKNYDFDLDNAFRMVRSEASPGWLSYHADYQVDRGGYEGLARVTTKGGTLSQQGNLLLVSNAEEVLVVIRVTPLEDGSESKRYALKKELAMIPAEYHELLSPHARKHGEMFRRVTLDLGAEKLWKTTTTPQLLQQIADGGVNALYLEMVHAMGRYLLISSSGKYPPPLMGIWGGGWKADWAGGFVLDSNLNLAISAAGMGNLPECVESYAGYIEGSLPGWRLNAKRTLGCRGFLPAYYGRPDKGYMTHKNPNTWYYICTAGWNLRPLYDYALLSGDTAFMKERVLPLYLEMADFYEDYLVKDKQGVLHITPGCSPENQVIMPNGERPQLADDCTIDIAVAREVHQILIELGEQFGLPSDQIAKWKRVMENIAPYRINEDGALAEWAPKRYKDVYNHRHNSHLYPIFPGYEFFQSGSKPELRKAAHVALEKRIEKAHLINHPQLSGHGIVFACQMAARLGDVKNVRALLEKIATSSFHYNSMVSSHCPDGLYYNLDVGLSYPRVLMEMLVFSHPGHIELMPAWPKEYADGSIKGVLVRGGHKIDITWKDGKLKSAVLYAGLNDHCVVKYDNVTKTLKLKTGETYKLDSQLEAIK